MATVKDFKEQLDEYCKRYNLHGPNGLPKGAKPSSALSPAWHIKDRFQEKYPNSDDKGIYLFTDLDTDLGEVIYVGKASLGVNEKTDTKIGDRLASRLKSPTYFEHGVKKIEPDPGGIVDDNLSGTVYLRTIPFPRDYFWEITALEEYLIAKLQPRGNILGVMRGIAVQLPPLGSG